MTTALSTPTPLTLEPLIVPASLGDPDAAGILALTHLGNAMCRHDAGHDGLDQTATEVLGWWQDTADWDHVGFTATRDGEIIGAVGINVSRTPGTTLAEFDLIVGHEHWGAGVEQALFERVERIARERGLSTLQTFTLHRPDTPGPQLSPPTGAGCVPVHDRWTRFARENGFTLEQVERNSVLDLTGPTDGIERTLQEALADLGPEYRLLSWSGATPPEYASSYAFVLSRMSTDPPAAALVVEEQPWDAERVVRRDTRMKAQGLTVSVAAVLHVPTDRVVAYNELVISEDRAGATQQFGTLVVREHRGHRLGMIVKCANLLNWRELVPESPRISTFNAEENRHMLDINEALGFVPRSYVGCWKKVLT